MSGNLPELDRVQDADDSRPPVHLDPERWTWWRRERKIRTYKHEKAVWEANAALRTAVRHRAAVEVADAMLVGDEKRAETLAGLAPDWEGTWTELLKAVDVLCHPSR